MTPITLIPGTRLGPYEIVALLGVGGMGEVYRATDTNLKRQVAIKVLPQSLATDPERLARFQREAELLALLNHPNIAHIHGLERSDGTFALVMELVEGPTLADRIAKGAIPLDEALPIAKQIAEALDAAHEQGIIHRDLKPVNIKVRADSTVKVLDFGLAKVIEARPAAGALSNSPTMLASMPGLILGTAAYMAPEQAKGQAVDRRADVWAFGNVLFEMLTGRAVFEGDTTSDVIAAVLKTDPGWRQLPASTPEAIRRLLRRSLQKDPTRRLRDIGDARLEIDEARGETLSPRVATGAPPGRIERLAWLAALCVSSLVAVALGFWAVRPAPAPAEVRLDINTPPVSQPEDLASLAISPDGREILFVASSDGQPHLWARRLDSVVPRLLPGTGGASFPFWSPTGRSVAFYADGFLKRIDLDGGLVRTLAKASVGMGGAWNRDGIILFVPNPASPISRISADGGAATAATRLDAGHAGHRFPRFLPDGRRFLYHATGGAETSGVHVGQLDGVMGRKLLDADTGAAYANGHLLFVRQGRVFAQPFDAEGVELKGVPFQIADGVNASFGGFPATPAAAEGVFAFRTGTTRFTKRFVWVDRTGRELRTVGERDDANPISMSPSPDGSSLAFMRTTTNSDIWLLELRRGVLSRLTDHPGEDVFPVWSRDGSRIVFSSNRSGTFALYQKPPTGNESEQLLFPANGEEIFASDTSPDGQFLLYTRRSARTGWDIWALPLRGGGAPMPVVQTGADERDARLSSDGKWVVYVSNRSGRFEIYLQPFPGPGPRTQVSTAGGAQVRWRSDDRELFYVALDGKLMAVPLQAAKGVQRVEVGSPVPLFATHIGAVVNVGSNAEYIVAADGQQFLMNTIVQEGGSTPITLVMNWKQVR